MISKTFCLALMIVLGVNRNVEARSRNGLPSVHQR
jgi:hypothetical protein